MVTDCLGKIFTGLTSQTACLRKSLKWNKVPWWGNRLSGEITHDRHNCFIDEQHNSNIFLNPYNLLDMVPAALLSLNHTYDRYSMSNQYPQPTTHQPRTDSYPVFSSLRRMDSQRKGLRVSFAFFQRNYLPDGRVNETVAMVEELTDLWKSGATDGIPPSVMNCNCI